MATRFKDNPYVWFNLFNEPDASFNDAKLGRRAPDALAGAAPAGDRRHPRRRRQNVIVIDDTQAGMGANDWWNIERQPGRAVGGPLRGAEPGRPGPPPGLQRPRLRRLGLPQRRLGRLLAPLHRRAT